MKQISFLLSFVGLCFAASSQEVKEKIKRKYDAPPVETKVEKVSTSSHKAYATHTTAHYAARHNAAKKNNVHHARSTAAKRHVVHKAKPVAHHTPYKKVKVKHKAGKTKVVHKT